MNRYRGAIEYRHVVEAWVDSSSCLRSMSWKVCFGAPTATKIEAQGKADKTTLQHLSVEVQIGAVSYCRHNRIVIVTYPIKKNIGKYFSTS